MKNNLSRIYMGWQLWKGSRQHGISLRVLTGRKQLTGPHSSSGQILIIALVFLAVVAILAASLFDRTATFLRFGSRSITAEQANSLAEAGIDKALWRLNNTAGTYTGEVDTALGTIGTFTVTVVDKSVRTKTITSTGYVPNATNPTSKRKITLDVAIDNSIISFNYGVQVGTGGLTMANTAKVNGNVYSNKTGVSIEGANSSEIIGDAFAVGTISSPAPKVTKTRYENQPASEMPTVDYEYWKTKAALGEEETCSPTCTISSDTTIGPKKYIGNLEVINNAQVTIAGAVWIAKDGSGNGGTFSMSQGLTKIKVSDLLGSNGTVLLAEGDIDLTQGGTFAPNDLSPKGYLLVATTSTSATALSISQAGQTALFYALEGTANLSQSASVTALVAKGLSMTQTASLTYETGLASASFTSGPGGSWQPIKGTYKYSD